MVRPLIERALEVAEGDSVKGHIPRIILEAPTGYGKSVAAPLFASTLIKHGLSYGFIHSLPLRAIVRDLYLCLLVNSLTHDINLREKCRKSEEVLREVAEALVSVSISVDQVAYQMGEEIASEVEGVRKEPLFNARYVATTLDSLAYNAFRVPVTEIFSPRKHYATPRLRIYLSTLYLDEAHTVYEEERDLEKSVTVFEEILKISVTCNAPVIVASATLSDDEEREIIKGLREVKVVKLGRDDKREGNYVYVRDKDFEDFIKSITWRTDFLEERELVSKVRELIESDLKVFVARDTVCSAIKTYKDLKGMLGLGNEEITLLHSLMTRQDREEALEKLSSEKIKVLVATSVVEAGVDMSFDALITDCGRPASIVQRVGRICRTPSTCRHGEATIYLVRNQRLNNEVEKFVRGFKEGGKEVSWRLPYDTENQVSYMRLLNSIRRQVAKDEGLTRKLRALTNPLIISSETIGGLLRNLNYALVRTYLAEVLVDQDRPDANIVTSLDKLAFLARRGCVGNLYVIFEDGEGETISLSRPGDKTLENESGILRRYFDVLRNLAKDHKLRRVSKLAYLLREGCYVDEEGVEYGVLCVQGSGS
ncbi:MAG: CRISPR-associated helicase Cas3' [Zestosphaera sp.]